jgi:hypothetical protein
VAVGHWQRYLCTLHGGMQSHVTLVVLFICYWRIQELVYRAIYQLCTLQVYFMYCLAISGTQLSASASPFQDNSALMLSAALPALVWASPAAWVWNDNSMLCTCNCTALHCTALHCTALHCTALHCTALQ